MGQLLFESEFLLPSHLLPQILFSQGTKNKLTVGRSVVLGKDLSSHEL